jgi:hypothetical protein
MRKFLPVLTIWIVPSIPHCLANMLMDGNFDVPDNEW